MMKKSNVKEKRQCTTEIAKSIALQSLSSRSRGTRLYRSGALSAPRSCFPRSRAREPIFSIHKVRGGGDGSFFPPSPYPYYSVGHVRVKSGERYIARTGGGRTLHSLYLVVRVLPFLLPLYTPAISLALSISVFLNHRSPPARFHPSYSRVE